VVATQAMRAAARERREAEFQQDLSACVAMVESKLPLLAGPEAAECRDMLREETVPFFSPEELAEIKRFGPQLQPMFLERLREGEHSVAYLLAYLKTQDALPLLKENLLTDRYFYWWEGPDYSREESYLRDEQYPHHLAYIAAIEHISGKAIWDAMQLSMQERSALQAESRKASPEGPRFQHYCARWLLMKLERPHGR